MVELLYGQLLLRRLTPRTCGLLFKKLYFLVLLLKLLPLHSLRNCTKIGIARVGNSYEYYIGPEAPDAPYTGPFRDEKLRLLKQAARFRVYEVDADGNTVGEVKASATKHIKWTVHLANKKASFMKFRGRFKETENLRNPTIQGNLLPDQRSELIIDVGPRSIEGVNQGLWFLV